MKLSEIFKKTVEGGDPEITSLAFDSKDVKDGGLFFCLSGTKSDGHDFAQKAVSAGAAAVVCMRRLDVPVPQIIVQNSRSALAEASSVFFGEPSKSLKMIAITGTNGKTTTTYIIKSILEHAGKKTGIIGTNAIMIGNIRREANLTTPDPIELHSVLKSMKDAGVEYVVMEASAHALYLNKLDGIIFDAAAFTNLSQDHLDFFENMDEYFSAKKRLFSSLHTRYAVLNADDARYKALISGIDVPHCTYGCLNPADVFAIDLKMSVGGIKYILNINDDIAEVRFNLPGKFNMYNTLCAAAVTGALGIELKDIIGGIRSLTKVDGRFNIINTAKCSVIIDFAHTDDGLRNILTTIREFAPAKIITVFGCGGDRDRAKRPLMGKVVSDLSDVCVITSDNPRTERPETIIDDIMRGVAVKDAQKMRIEPDRMSAILKAIEMAADGDIVLVAGKGAENYQEIMGVKQRYNDEEYILKLIEEKRI